MENRRAERTRKRMACSILLGDGRSAGLILDVSASGLFVQTGAKSDPGEPVTIEFEFPGAVEMLTLEGRVARRKSAPARLKSVVQSGIGVQIERAPEAFYAMVASLQEVDKSPKRDRGAGPPPRTVRPSRKLTAAKPSVPAAKPEEQQPVLRRLRKRYRVEVHEIGGRGARIVEVEAMNVAAAARRALEQVGEGWKVAGCELD